jgi:hypothetical protein
LVRSQVLYPAELQPQKTHYNNRRNVERTPVVSFYIRPASTSLPAHGKQFLVRLAGIEPTTPWFVAKYSIQLSYSRNQQRSAFYSVHYDLESLIFHL